MQVLVIYDMSETRAYLILRILYLDSNSEHPTSLLCSKAASICMKIISYSKHGKRQMIDVFHDPLSCVTTVQYNVIYYFFNIVSMSRRLYRVHCKLNTSFRL
jgi:hypothetical protein